MPSQKFTLEQVQACVFGLAVGDALGVPVEFKPRSYFRENPVTNMLGYMTHNQPIGTWSDDSSLTFCLMESLAKGYDLQDLAKQFINWWEHNHWTPHGKVFDIGIATNAAIHALSKGVSPTLAGGQRENDNGNGSLMRIAPLAFYLVDKPIEKRWQIVKDVSSLTHAHIRSILGGFIYVEFLIHLIQQKEKLKAYESMRKEVNLFLNTQAIASESEIRRFHNLLDDNILDLTEFEISSSGYVVSTLEASLWCFLKNDTYQSTVLQAVNLGEDTDTTATVTGALAGVYYGLSQIPENWIKQLARKNDIEGLIRRFYDAL